MTLVAPIRIDGLKQFNAGLKKVDADLPKALRLALNEAADVVVGHVKPRVPRRTGRAANSIKARSTRTAARISAGGRRAPYFPWLDFGGATGRGRSVKRPFFREGRYIYPGIASTRDEVASVLERALAQVARSGGFEVR